MYSCVCVIPFFFTQVSWWRCVWHKAPLRTHHVRMLLPFSCYPSHKTPVCHGVDVFVSVCVLLFCLLYVAVFNTTLVCAVRNVSKTLAREHCPSPLFFSFFYSGIAFSPRRFKGGDARGTIHSVLNTFERFCFSMLPDSYNTRHPPRWHMPFTVSPVFTVAFPFFTQV